MEEINKAAYYPIPGHAETSFLDALGAAGAGTGPEERRKIAEENGIPDYRNTVLQNMKLLALLKAGKLKKPQN